MLRGQGFLPAGSPRPSTPRLRFTALPPCLWLPAAIVREGTPARTKCGAKRRLPPRLPPRRAGEVGYWIRMPRGLSLIDPLVVPPTKPAPGVLLSSHRGGQGWVGGCGGWCFGGGGLISSRRLSIFLLLRGADVVPLDFLSLPVSGFRMADNHSLKPNLLAVPMSQNQAKSSRGT